MTTVTTGRATDFITFSRTSNATVTASDGKIKWAGHNLVLNSEAFDAATWAKVTSATVSANAVVAPNGTTTADTLSFPSAYSELAYSSSESAPGKTFTAGVWLKGSGTMALRISNNVDQQFTTSVTLTSTWTLYTVSGTFNSTAGTVLLGVSRNNGTATSVDAWGAHLYRSDLGGMVANPARGDAYYSTTPRNLAKGTESWGDTTLWAASGSASTVADAAVAPFGLQTADLIYPASSGANRQRYQSVNSGVAGTRVVNSAYLKAAGLQWVALLSPNGQNYGCYFDLVNGVKGTESSGVTGTITPVGNGWYRCSVSEVLSGTSIYGGISFADANGGTTVTANGSSGVYGWGIQFSDSASLDAYSPVYGAAQTSAAYYAPRLDYDGATLSPRGLLVEEQRANLVLRSDAFDNASWAVTRASITANTAVAPDGISSADKIVEDTSAGTHVVSQSVTLGNATYTASVSLKASERTFALFQMSDLSTGGSSTFVNLSTGEVVSSANTGSWTNTTVAVTNQGNGWYRVAVTGTKGAGTVVSVQVMPATDGSTNSYTGNGTSGIYVWGAQLEAGSFATSYIPTGSSTAGATRTADVASVATSAFPYSASEGTLVASASALSFPAGVSNNCLVAISDGNQTNANYVYSYGNTPYSATTVGGAVQANATAGSALSANTPYKLGYAYKADDFAFTSNGAAVGTDTAGSLPTANTMQIGVVGSTVKFNGWIRQITYLPRRVTNAELISRTAA